MNKPLFFLVALSLVVVAVLAGQQPAVQAQDAAPDPKAVLGRELFFDTALSANSTQSCAACHAAEVGYTGPDSTINAKGAVYPGALPNRFGNRKPPTAAYAGYSPVLHPTDDGWFGGMFWDGRATGLHLGDPLAEQAMGPFLNPLEQALPNAQVLCERVRKSSYAGLFDEAWGAGALDCSTPAQVQTVYENIGRSIAAFERSPEVNPFSSKFDRFWDNAEVAHKDVTLIRCGGGMQGCGTMGNMPNKWTNYRGLGLSDDELIGLAMFNDPKKADCASCHALTPDPVAGRPLFTDYGYDNIGVPKNPDNPFYGMPKAWNPDGKNWIDYGLGGYLKSAGDAADVYEPEMGKHKVPTLRNVALAPEATVKAYGHNGYFKSLTEIVFFYHWRGCMDSGMCGNMGGGGMGGGGMGGGMEGGGMDLCPNEVTMETMSNCFPAPEVEETVATLPMFPFPQVENIVMFLETLSDGYVAPAQ